MMLGLKQKNDHCDEGFQEICSPLWLLLSFFLCPGPVSSQELLKDRQALESLEYPPCSFAEA